MYTILHVSQPTDAGVACYVADLCADQVARGWNVAVACPDGGTLADALSARGVRRLRWQADRAPGRTVAGEAARLRRLSGEFQPDVVHLHSAKAGMAGRLAVRGRVPTIFQPHGWSWLACPAWMVPPAVAWERAAARWTSLFVCVGQAEAAQARARGLRGRYCVVRSGVDLGRFRPAGQHERQAARTALHLPAREPLVMCVGRITRQKGQDVLLRAWPAVRQVHPDARLIVVGDGDLYEPLRRQAPPEVAFVGAVDDVRPWYAAADLVVLPSRWEGSPLTLLEALAMGRPVVGSDILSIAEALPAGAGALVPTGDAAALAEAISERIGHPAMARDEGAVGARHAVTAGDARRTHGLLSALTARLAQDGQASVVDPDG